TSRRDATSARSTGRARSRTLLQNLRHSATRMRRVSQFFPARTTPVIGGGSGHASAMTARWANDWSGRALTRRYRLARVSVRRPSAWPGRLDIGRSTKSVGRPTTGLRRAHQGEQVGELPGPTTPSGELSSESRLPYSLSAHENQ